MKVKIQSTVFILRYILLNSETSFMWFTVLRILSRKIQLKMKVLPFIDISLNNICAKDIDIFSSEISKLSSQLSG